MQWGGVCQSIIFHVKNNGKSITQGQGVGGGTFLKHVSRIFWITPQLLLMKIHDTTNEYYKYLICKMLKYKFRVALYQDISERKVILLYSLQFKIPPHFRTDSVSIQYRYIVGWQFLPKWSAANFHSYFRLIYLL